MLCLEPNHALKQNQNSCFQVSEYRAVQSLCTLQFDIHLFFRFCYLHILFFTGIFPELAKTVLSRHVRTIVAREKGCQVNFSPKSSLQDLT